MITKPANQSGLTLVELMLAVLFLAITMVITSSFILSVRSKSILEYDADQFVNLLSYTRSQSITAYRGYAYSLNITTPNQLVVTPEGTKRKLASTTIINGPDTITFAKLTGYPTAPTAPFNISIRNQDFEILIKVDEYGNINKGHLEKI
jgi:Tfp pilus assembly protein PilV